MRNVNGAGTAVILEPLKKYFLDFIHASENGLTMLSRKTGSERMNSEFENAAHEIATKLKIEPAAFMAVAMVESNGVTGAQVDGKKEPLIRFEGHYFFKRLSGLARVKGRREGLASPVAGEIKNPNGQAARWQMLARARAIDEAAALESCSWGVGQVMGAHWQWLGFESVAALVAAARSGVAGQLDLMARFIEKSGLDLALRNKDWAGFAVGYNGPNFRQGGYDRKLREAYNKYALTKPQSASSVLVLGAAGEDVASLQTLLTAAGFPVLQSGVFDEVTERAVRTFQAQNGLVADGRVGEVTLAALTGAMPKGGVVRWVRRWLGW